MGLIDKLLHKRAEDNQPDESKNNLIRDHVVGGSQATATATPDLVLPKSIYPLKVVVLTDKPEIVPLKEYLLTAYPSLTGLYPHEILLLSYAEKYTTEQKNFQQFWIYQYGVLDVPKLLNDLQNRGYLELGSIELTLQNETIASLKAVLAENSLKVSGKKTDLISRLSDNLPNEKLWRYFPKRYYVLTEKGQHELSQNEYVVRCHRGSSGSINPWLMNQLLNLNPGLNYKEIIERYLQIKASEHYNHNDFGLYRNARLEQYLFYEKEERHEEAFSCIAEVLYRDLSGCDNSYKPELLRYNAPGFFPYETSSLITVPAATEWMNRAELIFGWDDATLEGELCSHMKEFSFPMHIFTPEECAKIVLLEKNQDKQEVSNIYKKAEQRFRKNHPEINIDKKWYEP